MHTIVLHTCVCSKVALIGSTALAVLDWTPKLATAVDTDAITLPSSDQLPELVPLLDRSQIVHADVLTSRAERQRRGLDIIEDATRTTPKPPRPMQAVSNDPQQPPDPEATGREPADGEATERQHAATEGAVVLGAVM